MVSSPLPTAAPRPAAPKRRRKLYENRIRWVSFLFVGPSFLASVLLIHDTSWTNESKVSLIILLLLLALIMEAVLHDQVIRPLQTFANVISSLREEDYSFRARGAAQNDALGELALEINALAQTLAERKTEAIEATELLKRVVEEIDVPLFTFDPKGRLRLVNTAGTALLHGANGELLGRTAEEIGLTPYLQPQTGAAEPNPLNPNTRWLVKKTSFREKGVPHTLFVLADVSHALREEERNAWRRLIRVLGHELNNSLTPIKSIAGTLRQRVNYTELPDHERVDFDKGLGIIESRAASLNRFLQGYRSLAQMPKPALRTVPLTPLIERIAALELRIPVTVDRGPETQANIDPDQFEQMLINLVRNAADAALEAEQMREDQFTPHVTIRWFSRPSDTVIEVLDNGPGLLNPENAFVPFYTTKAGGSGIGLALSRQVIEAHSGSIELRNRTDGRGCVARVVLPSVTQRVSATTTRM